MAVTELRFQISADTAQGQAALTRFKNQLKSLEQAGTKSAKNTTSAWGSFSGALKGIGTLAAGLGITFGALAVTQVLKGWISDSIEFQREFANVTTLVDTSAVNVDQLRTRVIGLGGSLGTSSDLAKGLYQTLSAGVAPAKSIEFLTTAARFATAALTDTFTSVDVLTTVINAYGLAASDAAKVSDMLFEVIKQGKITGQELAGALGKVIPTAATLGIGLDEVGAAIATLTKGGIKADEAVTSLNQVLLTFIKPSDEAAALAKQMGIELSAEAVAAKGLLPALKELAVAADGNALATATFFGNIRALKGVLSLTGPQAAEFERILDTMQNTAGNVNKAFEKQANQIGFQLTALWTNLGRQVISATDNQEDFIVSLRELNDFLDENVTALYDFYNAIDIISDVLTVGSRSIGEFTGWVVKVTTAFHTMGVASTDLGRDVRSSLVETGKMADILEKARKKSDELILSYQKQAIEALDAAAANGDVLQPGLASVVEAEERARKAAEALAAELAEYIASVRATVQPQVELVRNIKALESAGFSSKEIIFALGKEMTSAAAAARALDQDLDPAIESLLELARAKEAEAALAGLRGAFGDLEVQITAFQKAGATVRETLVKFGPAALDAQQVAAALGKELPREVEAFAALQKAATDAKQALDALPDSPAPVFLAKLPALLNGVTVDTLSLSEAGRGLLDSLANLQGEPARLAKDLEILNNQGVSGDLIWLRWKDRLLEAAEAIRAAGGEIPPTLAEFIKFHQEADAQTETAKKWGDVWKNQVSTIVTDLGKGLTDIIFAGKSFAETFKNIFLNLGRSLVRIFAESVFGPILQGFSSLLSGQGFASGFGGGGGLLGGLTGLLGLGGEGGAAGAAGGLGGLLGGGGGGLLGGLAGLFGGGGGIGALTTATATQGTLGGISGLVLTPASSGFAATIGAFLTNPWTAAIGGVIAAIFVLKKLLKKDPIESGVKEIVRDFGGISVAESQIKSFLSTFGIAEETFKTFRKSTLSSPAFLPILIDAAKAQGKVEQLIASFGQFETAWGVFDLSGPLREAIESGDFTAYNQAWANVFANSDQYITALGGSLEKLFNTSVNSVGATQESINALADGIKDLEEQGAFASDILGGLWEEIIAADTAARESNFTLDGSILRYVEMARVIEGATDSQRGLLVGLLQLQDAPARVSQALETLTDDIGFLREQGASSEQILQLMGSSIFQAAEAAASLGIELPTAVQELLDLALAAGAAAGSVQAIGEGLGFAGDAAAAFAAGHAEFTGNLEALTTNAAKLSGEIYAYGEALQGTMPDIQLQHRAWDLFGSRILSTYNELVDFRQEIPPFLQMLAEWALQNGYMIDSYGHLTEAIERTAGATRPAIEAAGEMADGWGRAGDRIRRTAEDIAHWMDELTEAGVRGVARWRAVFENSANLVDEILGFARAAIEDLNLDLTDQEAVLQLQEFAWQQFGSQVLSTIDSLEASGQVVPPLLLQMRDLAIAMGWVADGFNQASAAAWNFNNAIGGAVPGTERVTAAFEATRALHPLFGASGVSFDSVRQLALDILDQFGPGVLEAAVNLLLAQGGTPANILDAFRAAAAVAAGVPEFQEGGYVPRTGLAMVHQGEFVLSKEAVSAAAGSGPSSSSHITFEFRPTIVIQGGDRPEQIKQVVLAALEKNTGRFARRAADYITRAQRAS